MIRGFLTVGLLGVLSVNGLTSEATDAELEGRRLSTELLEQSPAENSTLTGVLRIRGAKGRHSEIPVQCRVVLTETNWQAIYETLPGTNLISERLVIIHNGTNANRYELDGNAVPATETAVGFAGSDFWLADLGLEFLHWPAQRVVTNQLRRSRSCTVLESINSDSSSKGYSRVVSWIDKETGGIIHADAYNAKGRKLKEFDPKEFKKVDGQWQLQEIQIRNTRTGSRTELEFNLDSKKPDLRP
jgi:hypothetical protein